MLRYMAGVASALLLVAAGFFIWTSRAGQDDAVPAAPQAMVAAGPATSVPSPPEATVKSKEEKRFGRADKNKDGRILLDELYQPRRKAFARLDGNADGRLSFEEWAISTTEKFSRADRDRSGWLSPKEYESTRPKIKARPKRCAC